jgi:hypothetical protein
VLVCRKGKKVKFRSSATCKGPEILVADLGNDLSGIWKRREGNGLERNGVSPAFLVLNADGTGRINRRGANDVLSCRRIRYTRGGGVPTIVLQEGSGDPDLATVTTEGSDVLRITDEDEKTIVFDRAGQVDAASECAVLNEVGRLFDEPLPSFNTGLARTDSDFVYLDDAGAVVAVRTDGAQGTSPTFPIPFIPQAAQGRDLFWGLSGSSTAVRSSDTGTVVDEVNPADFGEPARVICVAAPSAAPHVFLLAGNSNDFGPSRLLDVDGEAEPDTLLAGFSFVDDVQALAHDGTELWGLTGDDSVARIDPATGRATATFLVADVQTEWVAIAAAGGQVFLLGRAPGDKGVIATFAP